MLKIHQAKLQQYVKQELPDVQAGFRKGTETRDQIVNIHWIIEKAVNSRKTSTSASLTRLKVFDCMDHNKLWKILKDMVIPRPPPYQPVCRSRSNSKNQTQNNGLVPN